MYKYVHDGEANVKKWFRSSESGRQWWTLTRGVFKLYGEKLFPDLVPVMKAVSF